VGAVSRKRIAPSAVVWLAVGAVYFILPLVATLLFSLKSGQTNKCCTLHAYGTVIHDGQFWTTLKQSLILSVETIVVSLVIFVPTVYLVHLKLPKLRPVLAFLALIPFVTPPIVLVVGLLEFYRWSPDWFYGSPYWFLPAAYVILAFPYMFFSLDAGFRAIDVHTLTEASQSLGASWPTTLMRVIVPNIRVAALSGAFLALAIVMGEFTIASLAAFHTFPIYIQLVVENNPYAAAALTLISFGITWGAMLALLFVGRGRVGRASQVVATR
jgi:putative spermidine/putrescine transport system permease protein